jgi:hypothetical protein
MSWVALACMLDRQVWGEGCASTNCTMSIRLKHPNRLAKKREVHRAIRCTPPATHPSPLGVPPACDRSSFGMPRDKTRLTLCCGLFADSVDLRMPRFGARVIDALHGEVQFVLMPFW